MTISARECGTSVPWRGVPFLSLKQLRISPMDRKENVCREVRSRLLGLLAMGCASELETSSVVEKEGEEEEEVEEVEEKIWCDERRDSDFSEEDEEEKEEEEEVISNNAKREDRARGMSFDVMCAHKIRISLSIRSSSSVEVGAAIKQN